MVNQVKLLSKNPGMFWLRVEVVAHRVWFRVYWQFGCWGRWMQSFQGCFMDLLLDQRCAVCVCDQRVSLC